MQFSLMASCIVDVRETGADASVFLIQMYTAFSLFWQFLHNPLGTKFGTVAWAACLSNTKGAVSTLKIA